MRPVVGILGIAAICVAILSILSLQSAGIPDGYVSPYERSTSAISAGVSFCLLMAGIFSLATATFRGGPIRWTIGIAGIVLFGLALAAIDRCPQYSFCADAYLHVTGEVIDTGGGG